MAHVRRILIRIQVARMTNEPWFQKGAIENLSIRQIAEAIDLNGSVQLPTFQRDAIWNENRIEMLWDSMLRGFPIGSLLFATTDNYAKQGLSTKLAQDSSLEKAHLTKDSSGKAKFIIIDGQQRSIAIRLGRQKWRPGLSSRLWIDLAYQLSNIDEPIFHVCNIRRPWGQDTTNSQIRKAIQTADFNEFTTENTSAEYQGQALLGRSWPLRAKAPVPVAELLEFLAEGSDRWQAFIQKNVPVSLRENFDAADIDFKTIATEIRRLGDHRVPVHLIEGLQDIEQLGLAFQRINSLGVPMSQEELFYSGLKMIWPRAHDLVWEIYGDPTTGRFLEPAKMVHNVVRLAVAKSLPNGRSDVAELNLREFKSLFKGAHEKTPIVQQITTYLEKDKQTTKSRYHTLLCIAKECLQYHPETNPEGLPLPLLAQIHRRVWHTITAWLEQNYDTQMKSIGRPERLEIIRYAMFDHLFIGSGTSTVLAGLPFREAFAAKATNFPSVGILSKFVSEQHMGQDFKIPTPDEYSKIIAGENGKPNTYYLYNENALVFWAQRSYLHAWFPNYDPTLYRGADDLPFDVDHIIAGAFFHNVRNPHIDFEKIRGTGLHNTAGNLRVWPKNANRADQDNNIKEKGLLGDSADFFDEKDANSGAARYLKEAPLSFSSFGEIRQASALGEDDLQLWEIAAQIGDERNWLNRKRIGAFIEAVQNRRIRLYDDLFEALKLEQWLAQAQHVPWFETLASIEPTADFNSQEMAIYVGKSK